MTVGTAGSAISYSDPIIAGPPSAGRPDYQELDMTQLFDAATSPCLALAPGLDLVVFGDDLRRYPLPVAGELVLGRGPDCAIRIDHHSVSRRHAALAIERDGFAVRDLDSSNGTRVRGISVGAAPTAVAIDEVIELGGVGLVIRRTAPPAPRAPAPQLPAAASAMDRVRALLDRIASGTISVLILGETGVGKEVLAEAVHHRSPRASRPFLRLNCAALSETLLESELFGHERGAFTGADRTKPGLLETADGGTVFLDEIGELPIATQVKLLRVIEQREVQRVGGLAPRPIDVRFVAATHRDLLAEIASGRFRQDLYFRLNGITLRIPPLRERLGELDALIRLFVERTAARLELPVPSLAAGVREILRSHAWPGNIRELRNVIERAVLLAAGGSIETDHIILESQLESPPGRGADPAAAAPSSAESPARAEPRPPAGSRPLAELGRPAESGPLAELRHQTALAERERIVRALAHTAGNQKSAAELLGISRRTLSRKLDHYAINRPRKGAGRAA
jgi:DNA-binding NtrC family response regulator